MIFGGHVSIAGGYKEALPRAKALGGNALQMFSASPRGWNLPQVAPAEARVFREEMKKHSIEVAYFHASYLINLADSGPNGKHSVEALIAELNVAEALGVRGSIIHLGSFKEEKAKREDLMPTLFTSTRAPSYAKHPNYNLLISHIKTILEKTPAKTLFIIEDMGMRKIGRDLKEIAQIVSDVNSQRLKVCLDTCHLHAAGYDITTRQKLDKFLEMFDQLIGLERLECFHVNDSRDPFGSLRDRHANLGEGKVGENVFKLLLNHPKTKHLPFILEVPGFDDRGPDKKNMDMLKSFARDTKQEK
ncbi:MAG: hypothetical protein A2W52_04495 [Candidatus Taylorbacteria bacterium RIFCSPHIGHO2_02_49_25]|uniref:Probable endonuclease 4 n=1 Tax=Candidatus Taylorbacteria bacterium RIFCSPHIGHO2_02_49_25 TaxID=1802305 RepID=A0A1G2MFB9_9BACT|nr:MAG: putative endonuclease 4 [Parcubacteria group bacterium GW2011_GWF2_50_9]OHA21702.1 MAG: hypothetical protein A2W52_04495 [Candidatus Taylorbacteria bacterium RIFCSPHIGHO2_02_49_25]OHA35689.1 MAG: hypothetical protein A2W65_01315 [Candidatus Taylorbacteria bacterium RIFCSPLOWO2_02_50_13]OHA45843.1 MAG: hypothetical protein A3G61_02595 [Candidatus Taylorbacteria bacterium RIFCSPLOWO2_12_FULL_49_67]